MDKNSAKLIKELKKYYKAMAKYEKSRQTMQTQQSRPLRGSDKEVQKMLTGMGADVPSLVKGSMAAAQTLKDAHKKYLGIIEPPTWPPNDGRNRIPPDPNVFDVEPPATEGIVILPPPQYVDCPDCGFDLPSGKINFQMSDEGEGWGGLPGTGTVVTARSLELIFGFNAPRAGNVQVDVYVDFKGVFAMSAESHWYTNTSVGLSLSASSRLYFSRFGYWEDGPTITLFHKEGGDLSESGWINQYLKLSSTTSISDEQTILIFVKTDCSIWAQSSYARVDVDFGSVAERRIRVPVIRFRYL